MLRLLRSAGLLPGRLFPGNYCRLTNRTMNGLHSLQKEVSGKGKNKRRASDTDLRSSAAGSSATKKRRVVSAEKSGIRTSILTYFSPLSKSSSNLSNTSELEDSPAQHVVVQKQLNFDSVITIIDSDEEVESIDTPLSRASSNRSLKNEKLSRSSSEAKTDLLSRHNDSKELPISDAANDVLDSDQALEQTQELLYDESEHAEDSALSSQHADSAGQLRESSDTLASSGAHKSLPSYYMRNFFLILDTVLDKDKHLFDAAEWQLIHALKTAPEHTQRLYIRLYYRKGPWFQETKLETTYREIPDIVSPRNEMQARGLAVSIDGTGKSFSESDVTDLASMLSTAHLTQLLKSHTAGQQKVKRKDELLAALDASLKVKSQSTLFNYMTSPTTSRVDHWMRQILALTGPCLKLTEASKHVFQRAHRLFFLNRSEDATTIFLVNFGKVKYPIYITQHEDNNTSVKNDVVNKGDDINTPAEKEASNKDEDSAHATSTDGTENNTSTKNNTNASTSDDNASVARPQSTLIANQFVNWKTYTPCSVFASRDRLLQYEAALDLAQQMTALLGKETGESIEMSSLSFGDGPGTKQHAKHGKYDAVTLAQVTALLDLAVEALKSEVSRFQPHEIEVIDLDDTSRASSRASSCASSPVKEKQNKTKKGKQKSAPTEVQHALNTAPDLGPTLFLRRFTAGWIYTAMVHVGVSLHERLRDYKTAIRHLELLLDLPYVPHKRGHWWNRLALNLEHLNNKKKAFDACQKGLADKALSRACRLTLEQRLVRLGKNKHNWAGPAPDSVVLNIKPPRAVLVQGSTRPGGVSGRKSAFVGYNGAPCGVEELALQFYKLKGGWHGTHSEGEVFRALFTLLFWDIVYSADVPFVFQTPYQDAPLDLNTEAFYYNRSEVIEARLALIEHGTNSDEETNTDHSLYASPVKDLLTHAWNSYHGTLCRGLNWKHWELADLVTVAHCVGGTVLSAIFNRFARDYSRSGSGLPDLLLWQSGPSRAKFVEVKGPRDKLSDKQKVWIDVLTRAGADIEVFKVKEQLKPGEVSADLDLEFDQEEVEDRSPDDTEREKSAHAATPQ